MAARTDSPSRRRPPARILQVDRTTSLELDAGLQFMRALWVAVHALQKASKRMNARLGVTGPQRLVIRVVGLAPGISAGGLATVLHLHPSTVTGVLKRLEAQRLVSRVPHPTDARRAVLHLTPSGQRLNVAEEGTVESAARDTLALISTRDQESVRAALELLANLLDAQATTAKRRRRKPLRTA